MKPKNNLSLTFHNFCISTPIKKLEKHNMHESQWRPGWDNGDSMQRPKLSASAGSRIRYLLRGNPIKVIVCIKELTAAAAAVSYKQLHPQTINVM
jgi:hypothetical protein